MTEEIIIDVTKCDFNTFDGGGSQRTICTLDNCYCDGIRAKDCYYKELKRLEQENKELKEKIKKYSAINEQDTKDYAILRKVLIRIQTIINEVLNDRY